MEPTATDPPPPAGNYFAAIPARLPDGFLDSLRASAPDGLRWFHPDDLHFTLAFFGREDAARIPDLLTLIDRIELPLAEVTLGPLLALPTPRHPRALSFSVTHGHDALSTLIGHWRPALLQAAGCPLDARDPLPHLTIARPPRKGSNRRALLTWAESVAPPQEPILLSPPVLYGWSDERPRRQFRVIT